MTRTHPLTLVLAASALTLAACGGETASEPTARAQAPVIAPSGAEEASIDPPVEIEPAPIPEPVAEPVPEPSPEHLLPEPYLGRSDFLHVRRAAIATAVASREPVDPGVIFGDDEERIYLFLEMQNREEYVRTLTVTFEHASGYTSGLVTLDIPADVWRWRTWAFTRHAQRPGQWTALVADEDDEVIAEVPFYIEG